MKATLAAGSIVLVLSLTLGLTLSASAAQASDRSSGSHASTEVRPASYDTYLGDLGCRTADQSHYGGACDCLACRRNACGSRLFVSAEYLQWWNKGRHLPPLVTTSPIGTPYSQAGVLDPGGLPSATAAILLGDEAIGSNLQSGARLTLGSWLDDCESVAVAVRFFGVIGNDEGYSLTSDEHPILAVPFFNRDPLVDAEYSLVLGYPDTRTGSADITAGNEVYGGQAFLRYLVDSGPGYRMDMLIGYRYNRINDDLDMNFYTNSTTTDYYYHDTFKTRNSYNAGEVGLLGEINCSKWTLSTLGTISFGNMAQRVSIQGENAETSDDVTVSRSGGVFAQTNSNIGDYERNVACWAPEAGVKLSYAMTQKLSVSVGYTFLYWTRMVLAGDQIDRNVNASQLGGGTLVGPAVPEFQFKDTDFWVQTIDIGLSYNY
jgi:hypothetical protein